MSLFLSDESRYREKQRKILLYCMRVCLGFFLVLIKKHTCLRILRHTCLRIVQKTLKSQLFTVEQTCGPAKRIDTWTWWRQLEGWKMAVWWSTGDVGLCLTLGLGTGRCYWRLVLAGRGEECAKDSTAFPADRAEPCDTRADSKIVSCHQNHS